MPALPAVSGLVKAILTYAAPGVAEVLTRLFFQGTGSSSQSNLNTAAQTMANSWATSMAPQSAPQLALTSVQLEDLSSSTSPTGIWVGSKPGTSSVSGAATPAVCFIVKNGISDRYRGGHSRIYIPGINLGNVSAADATTWNTTNASAIASAWSTFLGNCVSALITAGYAGTAAAVPHFYKGAGRTWTHYGTAPYDWWKYKTNVATTPIDVDTYTAIGYNDVLGTQRRRTHQSP
jgi:hypothetical protein